MRFWQKDTGASSRIRFAFAVTLGAVMAFVGCSQISAQSDVRLPVVFHQDLTCVMPHPSSAAGQSIAIAPQRESYTAQSDGIVPLGNRLDDVGQYYSQVAPSLSSTIVISSAASITQTYDLHLFGDTGYEIRTYRGCSLASSSIHEWQIELGELSVRDVVSPTQRGETVGDICADVTEGRDEFGRLEPNLHGLYHANIDFDGPAETDVRVHTEIDETHPTIRTYADTEYAAVDARLISSTTYLPGILATRDSDNYWDTEIVVQNVTDAPIEVVFEICTDTGTCFDNNLAELSPYERRIFLASHLLYEPTPNGLLAHHGWHSAIVRASAAELASDEALVAVSTNHFRQTLEPAQPRPKAEYGSLCLYGHSPSAAGRRIEFPVSNARSTQVRLFNPTTSPIDVQFTLSTNSDDGKSDLSLALGPRETENMELQIILDQLRGANDTFGTSESVLSGHEISSAIQISASEPIAAFAWHATGTIRVDDGRVVSPDWYVPMMAAPIVPFQWDLERSEGELTMPAPQLGFNETYPEVHAQRPAWARRLNWYDARYRPTGFDRLWCNESDDEVPYSTHVMQWGGLYSCGIVHPHDRSCVNSESRLQELRNILPSSCPGHPILFGNEPDLSTQAFMTYHELGRVIYVLRDWPGQLFGPVFASGRYDRPMDYPEASPLCRQLVADSACPGTAGCEFCIHDGDFDGKIDPFDTSLKGLDEYFSEVGRWAEGEVWHLNEIVGGLLVHYYNVDYDLLDDSNRRIPWLKEYQEYAAAAGWPIVVKEYGFAVWGNEDGVLPDFTASSIAAQVDDLRRFLEKHLGGVGSGPGQLLKMFWYHSGCKPNHGVYEKLCLFSGPDTLSEPVGRCWYEDAVRNDRIDRLCGQ